MISRHLEVERKYAVPDGFALPSVTSAAVVRHVDGAFVLDASYFDTEELALLRRGVTLRRRLGGHDEGWHLKLPTSGGGRAELGVPLGRTAPGTVPHELATIVRALARQHQLVPVAHLRTHRSVRQLLDASGRVLAELALDDVEGEDVLRGRTTRWTEFEAELVAGDATILDDVEQAARRDGAASAGYPSKLGHALDGGRPGHPGSAAVESTSRSRSAAGAVAQYLDLHLGTLLDADLRLRSANDDADAVHDMRVAARRLRACLTTFRALLPSGSTESLRRDLAWIGELLGRARDADVLRSTLLGMVDTEPVEYVVGPVRAHIDEITSALTQRGRADLIDGLADTRYLAMLDELEQVVADLRSRGAKRRGAKYLHRQVRHEESRLQRRHSAWRTAAPADVDAALHDIRKATKRVRYAHEVLVESRVRTRGAKHRVKQLRAIQDVLGAQHDAVVAKAALRSMGANAPAARQSGFTFGRLHARAEADARSASKQFERRCRRDEH